MTARAEKLSNAGHNTVMGESSTTKLRKTKDDHEAGRERKGSCREKGVDYISTFC